MKYEITFDFNARDNLGVTNLQKSIIVAFLNFIFNVIFETIYIKKYQNIMGNLLKLNLLNGKDNSN